MIAIVATALIALAISIAIGALIKDNRIERLRDDRRAADAATRVATGLSYRCAVAAEQAEQRAKDAELSVVLMAWELERLNPRPDLRVVDALNERVVVGVQA